MKTPIFLSLASLLAFATFTQAADSKRTADYLLTTPDAFVGKEVTVDIALVKPVHWTSPFPEITFFQAMTMDRQDRKPGGAILVAVNTSEAAKFAKKYGTNFEGRADVDQMKGVFENAGGPQRPKIWLIDTTGKLARLIAERKSQLPEGAGEGFAGGPGMRMPRPGGQ